MSVFRQLLSRMFPRKVDKILILGMDNAGKTTLLYKLKLDEIVTTIPTMGFNVETVSYTTDKGTLSVECWDVGGCDKIRPLLRHYFSGVDAVVWVVDSNDGERLAESVDVLQIVVAGLDEKQEEEHPGVPKHPVLILANKRDLSNILGLEEIKDRFSSITKGRPCHVFPTSSMRALEESGSPEALGWLAEQLQLRATAMRNLTWRTQANKAVNSPGTPGPNPSFPPNSTEAVAQKLESYLTRAESDSPPKLFLKQFFNLELPSWDHYTHVRLAFVILTVFGRQKGKDMLFDGIQQYVTKSKQAIGRTFHLTMTYFWIQIVHFGIRSMPPMPSLTGEAKGISGDGGASFLVGPSDFSQFLLMNPYVADGALWSDYYSKDTIMSPKAKEEMVLPDKKPLPNLVTRDAVHSRQK